MAVDSYIFGQTAMVRVSLALVLLVCAVTTRASSQHPRPQRDQYVERNDAISTSNTFQRHTVVDDKRNQDEEVPQVPLRHQRQTKNQDKSTKNNGKSRTRSYWNDLVAVPPASYYSMWPPQAFAINRPYFIPAYGAAGGKLLFFPPQPVLMNPGYPPHNPMPVRGYLPPYENPPTTTTETPFIMDKFGEDAPVWDREPAFEVPQVVPTRRPRPQTTSTFPPIFHSPKENQINELKLNEDETAKENKVEQEVSAPTPPSRCVWAIISCCSDASQDLKDACFEQLGCSGPFWDKSPCDSEFAKLAIDAALEYYNTGSK